MDRNNQIEISTTIAGGSLSARRAWIEIPAPGAGAAAPDVALRKESVDRNRTPHHRKTRPIPSLSARRAWIEIFSVREVFANFEGRSPQGERG